MSGDLTEADKFMLVWQYADGVPGFDLDQDADARDRTALSGAVAVLIKAGANELGAAERSLRSLREVRLAIPNSRMDAPGAVKQTGIAARRAARALSTLESALASAELSSVLAKAFALNSEQAGGPSVYMGLIAHREPDAVAHGLGLLREAIATAEAALGSVDIRGAPRRARQAALARIGNHYFTATRRPPLVTHDPYNDSKVAGRFHAFVESVCLVAGSPHLFSDGDFERVAKGAQLLGAKDR